MLPKSSRSEPDLFTVSLKKVIDLEHPLVKLAALIDWDAIRREIEPVFCDDNGRPATDVRVVMGLFYLKSAFDQSDEQLIERWVENPYWQWFCGFTVMQHKPPIDPTTLSRWRSRLGAERLEILLQQTIHVARRTGQLRKPQLEKINIDTTVQPKAIAFPTDARLYFKAARSLVRLAQNAGVVLRRSYKFTNKTLLVMQGRYSRAKHYRRARKCERKLRTHLGCLLRDMSRKLTSITNSTHREALEQLLTIAWQIFKQQRTDSPKVYSVHEPHVECIAKGKAHKKYEFGCKVSLATTNANSFIVGVLALHGNPFDGHTLQQAIDQVVKITEVEPAHIMVDRGYRGHDYEGSGKVHVAGRIPKTATRAYRKMLKRRSAIEPTIGHLKSDHRMERNYLKGREGDRINALVSAIGYNLRKLMAGLACAQFLPILAIDKLINQLCQLILPRQIPNNRQFLTSSLRHT
ncbi:Transposase DDE domain protein [Rubinisphaera italica]|uniref:Transposase DDE domain protein n=1 Tax=Rubinisphaera italica TaxID=2527969 RepID=A0A5C5XK65_9PLAN|nr:IS5 family transposase [Rubinisphaera italica]TWT60686.1 Transposase DDE domain protein [Rubinisphaera italica]TWT61410.1 Transposase DDE domain protein [Rubinisphaera italica]TWT63607.1 Transposase DDE domain protein [Rubinisphaera italica]